MPISYLVLNYKNASPKMKQKVNKSCSGRVFISVLKIVSNRRTRFRHCKNLKPLLLGIVIGILLGAIFTIPFVDDWRDIFGQNPTHLFSSDVGGHNANDPFHSMSDLTLANRLGKEVKILCWIMTGPTTHRLKAIHVKNTWGKKCNYLLFMSSEKDLGLDTIKLPVTEDRDHLYQKAKEAMKYVYKHYYNKADWFFKADDDTYTIMENMRYLLSSKNSSEPIYFGCRFRIRQVRQGYMSGGAGYVLSKEALRRLVVNGLQNPKKCGTFDRGAEDLEMGKCLENVGVKAGDSRDELGRHRFLPIKLKQLLISERHPPWVQAYLFYPLSKKSMNDISDSLITLHYTSPEDMYTLEFLIYHVKAFGVAFSPTMSKVRKNMTANSVKESQSNHTEELAWVNLD